MGDDFRLWNLIYVLLFKYNFALNKLTKIFVDARILDWLQLKDAETKSMK